MTVTLLSNTASASKTTPVVVSFSSELVRGTEDHWMGYLMPRVRQESVALDLSGVERIDAAGIATLITLYCTSVEAGTDFSIVSPSAHVTELLRIVGLESILIADCRATGSGENCLDQRDRSAA
jgi:anti-anti-sigma factor